MSGPKNTEGNAKNDPINPVEKGIIGVAIFSSAIHLGLIAFAAIKLGISVPTCVTDVKPFESGAFFKHGPRRYEAHILAKMWNYEPSRIKLPTGSTLDIFLVSKDVNHGFHINGTNVNLMAVPFVVNNAKVKFDRPGNYPIICHEYCGAGHQAMNAVVEVSDQITEGEAEGIQTVNPSGAATGPTVPATAQNTPVLPGRKHLDTKGCIACHSLTGTPGVGPTFKGLWGRTEAFTDGTSQVVDAAYIKESILEPQKKLVKGFGPVMPKLPVSDQEIIEITDYLKTVK